MRALEWNRLTEITKTQKPFRGTTNRFPIGKRTHNTKCFYLEERNGEKVYVITYGHDHTTHFHTEEEYKASPSTIHYREWADEGQKYASYVPHPREMGIVRSDNTFEFTGNSYGQGENMLLTQWSLGTFFRSSRHGGMVYRQNYSDPLFHPIFKGMRVYCDTMRPVESSQYKIVGRRVSRKDANEFLKKYEDFYTINETMFKAMEWGSFIDTVIDIGVQNGLDFEKNWYLTREDHTRLLEFANKSLNDAPLDSCVSFLLAYDIKNMYSNARGHTDPKRSSYYAREIELDVLFSNLKRKLNKELYSKNPTVMKPIEHEAGKYYPPSEWGVEIYVDGKEVEQY
jgi:hypothetical protein